MDYFDFAQMKKALDDREPMWQPSDNNLLAAAFDPTFITGQVVLPGAGVPVFARVRVPAGVTITNVVIYVAAVAAGQTYSAAAVYEASGTRVGLTASQITAWQSLGTKTMALSAPIAAQSSARFVYVGLLSEGGTAPTLAIASAAAYSGAGLAAAPWPGAYAFAAAPLPTSMNWAATAPYYCYWVGLS